MKRFSYIIETIIILAIVIVLSLFTGNPGYIDIDFHPFYFLILLITARYGSRKGSFSMLISAISYIIIYLDQAGYTNIQVLWEKCYQPLAFVAFWIFIGLIIDIDKKKIETLTREKRKQSKTLLEKENEIKHLIEINENISNELIVTDKSFNILFEKTKNLFSDDISTLYNAAYDLLIKTIQASKAYILYLDGDRYIIASSDNPVKDWRYYDANIQVIEQVRKSHEFIRFDTLDTHTITRNTPVFVGPIIHQDTDTLYGIIIVQELEFLNYNKNTYRTFINLCKWLGEILYFRTNHNLKIAPVRSSIDFNFLIAFGSSRDQIRDIVKKCIYNTE